MTGKVLQLNISPGGMPKRAIASARITAEGVAGDWQTDRRYHGGPSRAVCLFSRELIEEFGREGIELFPGAVGENLTTDGIDLRRLNVGDRLRVGQCLLEITKVRVPCSKLKRYHKDLPKRIEGRSGWLAKVVEPGEVRQGDPIQVVPRTEAPPTEGDEP